MNIVKFGALALTLVMSQTASASFWGKVKNAFNDCKYDEMEYQQVYQFEKENTAKLQEHFSGRFTEQDFNEKPWLKDFRYVIVVNKAERGAFAQTMRVYEYGLLIHQTKV